MTSTISKFFVFMLDYERTQWGDNTGLVKILEPYDGHLSFDDAKDWIRDYGNPNTNYMVMEVFKNP